MTRGEVLQKKDPYWWMHPAYKGEQALELLMAQQFNERSAANMRKVAETQSMYMQFKAG